MYPFSFFFFFALPRQFTQRHYGPCIGGGILDMASTEYTAGKRGLTNKRSAGKREWYVFCSLGAWVGLLLSHCCQLGRAYCRTAGSCMSNYMAR